MPAGVEVDNFQYKALDGALSVDEAKGIVECFVAAIGNKDSVGDIIVPGAFNDSLKRRLPRVVWGHDWNHPIGKVLDIYEVGPRDPRLPDKMRRAGVGGLYARVQFNLKSEKGREAFSNIVFFGGDQEWSIGYKTLDAVYDSNTKANMLRTLELYEVSPVLHGANQLTATISIKSDQGADDLDSFRKSKWKMFDRAFAEMVKKEHPRIWDAGGNIKGNDQYEILTRIAEQDGVAKTQEQIDALKLREAWVARHEGDFLLPGVVAQIKWLAVGSRGEDHMKKVVREAILKNEERNAKGGEPLRTGSLVRWQSSGGIAYGKIIRSVEDGNISASPDGPTMVGTSDDPAFGVQVWRRGADGWEATDAVTVHRGDALTVIENLPGDTADKDAAGYPSIEGQEYALRLAKAIAKERGGKVRLREFSRNMVVFDHRSDEGEMTTMRVSYHFDGEQFMIGDPEKVKPTTVYLAVDDNNNEGSEPNEDTEESQEYKAPVPPDVIPQERITGDVLRGYGPRRGNLERLLRYWRPIMRKPGGFRRCLVILADHPELYPLQNICAWLHHETTGLWPNEGCHHPGMKNCRRKLRGVANGSIWSDAEFGDRIDRLTPGKSAEMDGDGDGEVTEDDIAYANKVLSDFMGAEKDFMEYLADEKNWEHVGDDEDGNEKAHDWVSTDGSTEGVAAEGSISKPGGCNCGCGGKSASGSFDVKVGRVLSASNIAKLQQAMALISEVVGGAGSPVNVKGYSLLVTEIENLFGLKSFIDPLLSDYAIDAEVTEHGIVLHGAMSGGAEKALGEILADYMTLSNIDIQIKSLV